MASINDVGVCEKSMKIQRLARSLSELAAKGNEMALFIALSDIEKAAHDAQHRLNELLYGKGYVPAEEQMGT